MRSLLKNSCLCYKPLILIDIKGLGTISSSSNKHFLSLTFMISRFKILDFNLLDVLYPCYSQNTLFQNKDNFWDTSQGK